MSGKHRGRRILAWLTDDEFAELEALRAALATSTGLASITRVTREALGALALEVLDRRARSEPVELDRRATSPGRRRYDRARIDAAIETLDQAPRVRAYLEELRREGEEHRPPRRRRP